jgi:pimeloyl-ACP methyl ester carboxylesterase
LTDPLGQTVELDGRRLAYVEAGPADGPVVVLVHGLLSARTTWQPAIAPLAERGLHVIALDLPGHGDSDVPAGGHYLSDYASAVSAFLAHPALGLTGPVTLAGHSLGAAIAMQFAQMYPEQLGRLVLVSAGGLGRQIHPILRAATLPGVENLLRLTVNPRTAGLYARPRLHRALRLGTESVVNLTRMGQSIMSDSGRATFVSSARAVITPAGGQLGNMLEHGFVPDDLPTLIVWSANDPIIPVQHAIAAHERLPNSRLDLFAGATHEPHRREPERFAEAVATFIAETSPAP